MSVDLKTKELSIVFYVVLLIHLLYLPTYRAALAAYIKQDLWLAVDLFDEAANLGIHSAQVHCAGYMDTEVDSM